MSSLSLRAVERTRVFTPLGIRFWDVALDVPVLRELDVHAWLLDAPFAPTKAVRSPSGVYVFHRLPARRESEFPGERERPEDLGSQLEYAIIVDDPAGAFLPVAFSVMLPLGYRGEFLSVSVTSEPGGAGRAYLFAAPSRRIPPGLAAIRADVEDADTGEPAAWAVLRATLEGRESTGIADERGRVLLLAPLPTADRLGLGSPPGSGQGPLAGKSWPVTLRVEYQPEALRYPLAGAAELPGSWVARPSLKSILDEQNPALVTTTVGDDPVTEWTAELSYGEELLLRSRDAEGEPLSAIRVHAGASIP